MRVGGVTAYPGTFGRFIEVSALSAPHVGVRILLALSRCRRKTIQVGMADLCDMERPISGKPEIGARFSGKSSITKK